MSQRSASPVLSSYARLQRFILTALLCWTVFTPGAVQASEELHYALTVNVNFGQDLGQPLGSLFEVRDSQGEVVLGAGFASVYNTMLQGNRHELQLYLHGDRDEALEISSLPRPSPAMGTFITAYNGELLANAMNYGSPMVWDSASTTWREDTTAPRYYQTPVASGNLVFRPSQVEYQGRTIFASERTTALFFYGAGNLFAWEEGESDLSKAKVHAVPWTPDRDRADMDHAATLELATSSAFPYCYGVLDNEVLMVSNLGWLYGFDGEQWRLIQDNSGNVFQMYTMLNVYDRLLLGNFPTGGIYAWDGNTLEFVSAPLDYAHSGMFEAQTFALYGGDLYVGMWPWGELWRYSVLDNEWNLAARLFSHPERDSDLLTPYRSLLRTEFPSREYSSHSLGQRVYSLLPLSGSLYASTSARSGRDGRDIFHFLSQQELDQYGAVHRITAPTEASAQIRWTGEPTTFVLEVHSDSLRILQDGVELARSPLDSPPDVTDWAEPEFGYGIFGPLGGDLLSGQASSPASSD